MMVEPLIAPAKAMEPPVDSSVKVPRLVLEDTCPLSSMDVAVMVQAEKAQDRTAVESMESAPDTVEVAARVCAPLTRQGPDVAHPLQSAECATFSMRRGAMSFKTKRPLANRAVIISRTSVVVVRKNIQDDTRGTCPTPPTPPITEVGRWSGGGDPEI